MSAGAVTMLALPILLYLYFKWRVTRCCNSREAELTQVITKPSAPTSDLEMALRMNQSLRCSSCRLQLQQTGIQQGQLQTLKPCYY